MNIPFARGRRGLANLAQALNEPEEWENTLMEWDFGVTLCDTSEWETKKCGTMGCAMGLAAVLWPEFKDEADRAGYFAAAEKIFSISENTSLSLFGGCGNTDYYPKELSFDETKPSHVAAAIRKYLSEHPE